MTKVPFHIKLLWYLGFANIKVVERKKTGILEFDRKPRRRTRFPKIPFTFLAVMIPLVIGIPLGLFDEDPLELTEEEEIVQEVPSTKAMIETERLQGLTNVDLMFEIIKVSQDKYTSWTNEDIDESTRKILLEAKLTTDNSNCEQLIDSFINNPEWSIRPYVAETIMEKGCQTSEIMDELREHNP